MNVWIAAIIDKRKRCYNCEAEIKGDNKHISVGEYVRGKYRKAFTTCGECMVQRINGALHAPSDKDYTICVRSGCRKPWYKESV